MPDCSNDNLYSVHFSTNRLITGNDVFQDFNIRRDRGVNVNAVHFLWSNTYTNSSINGIIFTENDRNFLRLNFVNGERAKAQGEHVKGWASNVKIKPIEDAAFDNDNGDGGLKFTKLNFIARSPLLSEEENGACDVAISARLLDRRLNYWEYASASRGGTPSQFKLSSDWEEYEIDLIGGGYKKFEADGNNTVTLKNKNGDPIPDFSVFAGVVFVVGSYSGGREEPGIGSGVVDIGEIQFSN